MQGKIIKVEERAIGSVKGSVYWAYIKAWGPMALPMSLIAAAFLERAVAVFQNYWLKVGTFKPLPVINFTLNYSRGAGTSAYTLHVVKPSFTEDLTDTAFILCLR